MFKGSLGSFKRFYFMCAGVWPACVSILHALICCGHQGGQEMASDSWELKLEKALCHNVGSGNETSGPWKIRVVLKSSW